MSGGTTSLGRPVLGRGDLVDAIASGQPEILEAVARQLGLEHRPPTEPPPRPAEMDTGGEPARMPTRRIDSSGYPNRDKIENLALWLPTSFAAREPIPPRPDGEKYHDWRLESDAVAAKPKVLAPWSVLGPRLRQSLTDQPIGRSPDLRALVARVARREIIADIPRQHRRRWGTSFYIVKDNSLRLSTFQHDQETVIETFRDLLPTGELRVAEGSSPHSLWLRPKHAHETEIPFQTPPPGSQVLVLSDLGCLARSADHWRLWFRWGRELKRNACHLLALVPCGNQQLVSPLTDIFAVQSWQPNRQTLIVDPTKRRELVQRLLVLASPALRLEPGLLRDLRMLIPEADDASLEIDVWTSELLSSNHPIAATIDHRVANEVLRPQFELLPKTLRQNALRCIRNWRVNLRHAPEIWFEEVLCLSEANRELLPSQDDIKDARASVRELARRREADGGDRESVGAFLHRFTARVTPAAQNDSEVGHVVRDLQRFLHPNFTGVAAGTDPREIPGEESRTFRVDVNDKAVTISVESDTVAGAQSPALTIRSTNQYFEVADVSRVSEQSFWKTGRKPSYAVEFGTDQYGAWFEFAVPGKSEESVRQRMRWVPAGEFLMGSADDEAERYADEGPQHPVTLTKGFWMADTPCTQAMWMAVTGTNPSQFRGDDLPVENVSWDDVQLFFEKLGKQVPEMAVQLPTEAQWEYSCRAGTKTRYWFGDDFDPSKANCGGQLSQTSDVKLYPPNPLGLFDVHGNVWQWCSDFGQNYEGGHETDPKGPGKSSSRVIRGGSWLDDARYARSAYRDWIVPGIRDDDLGFRCLSSSGAEPNESVAVPVAEQGMTPTHLGEAEKIVRAQTVKVDLSRSAKVESFSGSKIGIHTDVEEIGLDRLPFPEWAKAFGQDVFGIYADLEIAGADSPPVRQRLRWIAPGRFRMGSPTDEPGRSDDEVQHDVTISDAFWMFDTPCTQALWQTVMDENPSRFIDPDRPVEQVDWEQANRFAAALTSKIGQTDLNFSLPSEAQWEYACRAGTTTALYSGPLEIIGNANAPALDEIAWYGGNSGHEYDHDESTDISDFKWLSEKQYDFKTAGTRKVKRKHPNHWGLYDMLGNVFEWCGDWHGDYQDKAQRDPKGPVEGSDRVIRGGSWFNSARDARSACRSWFAPGFRDGLLGFRCLSSVKPVAEQVSAATSELRDEAAEQRRTQ